MRKTILQGAIANFLVKSIYAVITFSTAVILARELGTEEYGIYTIAFTIASLLAIPTQFGTPLLLTREVAGADAHQNWGIMKGVILFSHKFVWIFSFTVISIAVFILFFFEDSLGEYKTKVILLSLLLIPLLSLGALRDAILRGLRKVTLGLLTEQILRPLLFLIFISLLIIHHSTNAVTAYQIIVLHAVASVVAFLGGLIIYLKNRPPAIKHNKPEYENKKWLTAIIPLGLIGALHLINSYADILLIGLFKSDQEVAFYKVSIQTAFVVEFILVVFNSVLAPHFSRLCATDKYDELQKLVTFSSRIIILVALPIFLLIILFGEKALIFTFGQDYICAYIPLVIISFGQVVNASVGCAGLLLNMTGHEKDVSRGIAISAVFNLTLNLILIPPFGINGAAIATATSLIVWNFLLWKYAGKKLNIQTLPFTLFNNKP